MLAIGMPRPVGLIVSLPCSRAISGDGCGTKCDQITDQGAPAGRCACAKSMQALGDAAGAVRALPPRGPIPDEVLWRFGLLQCLYDCASDRTHDELHAGVLLMAQSRLESSGSAMRLPTKPRAPRHR